MQDNFQVQPKFHSIKFHSTAISPSASEFFFSYRRSTSYRNQNSCFATLDLQHFNHDLATTTTMISGKQKKNQKEEKKKKQRNQYMFLSPVSSPARSNSQLFIFKSIRECGTLNSNVNSWLMNVIHGLTQRKWSLDERNTLPKSDDDARSLERLKREHEWRTWNVNRNDIRGVVSGMNTRVETQWYSFDGVKEL